MEDVIKKIEEKTSLIQQEMIQMSDELYNQQKEITELKFQIKKLKFELHGSQANNGHFDNEEEKLPPHY